MAVWKNVEALLRDIESSLQAYLKGTPAAFLSPVSAHILSELYAKDGQMASILASATGRAATSFTPLLDKLEHAQLIRRQPDSSDRRAVLIFLTKEGAALKPHITEALAKLEEMYPEVSWRLDEPIEYELTNA